MLEVACPICNEKILIHLKDVEVFNRISDLGKHEMLYWKYKHRICFPGGCSGPLKADRGGGQIK